MSLAAHTSFGPYRHQPLIAALASFYATLSDLSYISPSDVIFPSPQTGMHSFEDIDAERARHAGFSDEVIELIYRLPYLSEDASDIQLAPNTTRITYLRQSEDDEGMYDDAREVLSQGRQDMPHQLLILTWGQVYGTYVIYDVQTGTYLSSLLSKHK